MIETTPAAAGPASRSAGEQESRVVGALPIIQVCKLEKTYSTARGPLTLFQNLDMEARPGELVAIVGQSGAGKSTLLHILGALDAPTAGTVHCASTNVTALSQREASAFRNREIGYVWQFHYLLPEFSALENVGMPLLARGVPRREAFAIASNWLKEVDLEDRSEHRPGELSGGEQQRVALARALVTRPSILLMDEPLSSLDDERKRTIASDLLSLQSQFRFTLIYVTHDRSEADMLASRVCQLRDGRVTDASK